MKNQIPDFSQNNLNFLKNIMIHSFWVANFVHALFLCAAVKRKFSSLGSKLPVAKLATGVSAGLQNWIMVECRRATLTETKKISRKKSVWQPGNHDHVFLRICTTIACFTPKSLKKEGQMWPPASVAEQPLFSSHFLLKNSDVKKGSFNCSLPMKPESFLLS